MIKPLSPRTRMTAVQLFIIIIVIIDQTITKNNKSQTNKEKANKQKTTNKQTTAIKPLSPRITAGNFSSSLTKSPSMLLAIYGIKLQKLRSGALKSVSSFQKLRIVVCNGNKECVETAGYETFGTTTTNSPPLPSPATSNVSP